ncbi:HupE/UreJ family protein [Hymenobacter elongatus]|uniref:HupE/UreJ family protein n=1 Tax=Hymenobacter elongatus TaxID=877208 RepID=A0A4Z0PFS8_9BACT|nr:HupE/UreJ family protein [Hymenobacter elongatus]TGE13853.1 HupE/UreJ family protein [Hymenobacter elongatus]
MSVFQTYVELGFFHIFNLQAYDHLVFLLALCAPYVATDWRRVAVLVTSFTLGHSVTLALATLGFVRYSPQAIEVLIPITILLTCALNLRHASQPTRHQARLWAAPNVLAAVFGLIHGLGFSSYLRELLGSSSRPLVELLAFNVGVELGQLLIVALLLALGFVVVRAFRAPQRDWVLVVSGAAAGVAVVLLLQNTGG